jgi:apolipoprotein N-acyltransferase
MVGVSLLVALAGTTLAWVVLEVRARPAPVLAGAGVLVGTTLLAVLVTPGATRVGEVTVAAVQGDVPGSGTNVVAVHRLVTANHVQATVRLAQDVAAGDVPAPDFVVWPENSTAVDPFTDSEVNEGVRTASDAIGVPILVGGMVDDQADDQQVLNQGIVWWPGTGGGDRYTKRHPVPYGEYIPFRGSIIPDTYGQLRLVPRDMARGTRLTPLRIDDALVADAICFDVAYDDGISAQVSRGAQLVTVQTSNAMFVDTGQIHQQFEISRLRALEAGRWVVVAAINGVSGVIDPQGRVVASAGARTQEVLVERIGLRSDVTPAMRMGVWPGRVVMVVVGVHAVFLLVTYRRNRKRAAPEAVERRQEEMA